MNLVMIMKADSLMVSLLLAASLLPEANQELGIVVSNESNGKLAATLCWA